MSRFDVEKFDPPPDPDLVCCICQCVLDSPMESPCRHVFCKVCIETWLTNHRNCPTCRRNLRIRRLKPVLPLVQNMINRLQLFCDFSTNGCDEKLMLEQYDNHIKTCGYEKLKCRFSRCGKEILRKDLKVHEEDLCEFREKQCNRQCGLMIPILTYDTHDCFVELQKFASESTSLVEKLKKSVQELTEVTKTMKKTVEDLSRELQRHRNRSPSPSSWYSFTSSGDESDRSNFILDDFSNDRYSDNDDLFPSTATSGFTNNQNNNTSAPLLSAQSSSALNEGPSDQRRVRWHEFRREPPSLEMIQFFSNWPDFANVNSNNNENRNETETVGSSMNTTQVNRNESPANNISTPDTQQNCPSNHGNNNTEGDQQNDLSEVSSRNATRSRSHIWDSDNSPQSSSSSDVDRDEDNNDSSFSYSFSSTPINSPTRSHRSRSDSESTLCSDNHASPVVDHDSNVSSTRERTLSEDYTDDEREALYSQDRSEYSSGSQVSDNPESTHDASNLDSDDSIESRRDWNTSMDSTKQSVKSRNRERSFKDQDSTDHSSDFQSDQNSGMLKDYISSYSSEEDSNPRNLSYSSSDQENNSECPVGQESTKQPEVVLKREEDNAEKNLSRDSVKHEIICETPAMHSNTNECLTSVSTCETQKKGSGASYQEKTSELPLSDNCDNDNFRRIQLSPFRHQKPRKRSRTSYLNTNDSSCSGQEQSPSPKKRFVETRESSKECGGTFNIDSWDTLCSPQKSSAQSTTVVSENGLVPSHCQTEVTMSCKKSPKVLVTSSSEMVGDTSCDIISHTNSLSPPKSFGSHSISSSNSHTVEGKTQEGQAECAVTRHPTDKVSTSVSTSVQENLSTNVTLRSGFDLQEYNSDSDDTWDPEDSVRSDESDYDRILSGTDDTDSNDSWSQDINDQVDGSDSSHDTWDLRNSRDNVTNTSDDDSSLSDGDIDSDSSYEVRIPMSVAQLLNKYASEDHDSDDSWTPP